MSVEHSMTVLKSVLRSRESRRQLIDDARDELVALGLATKDELASDPKVVTSGGEAGSSWVHVTLSWPR